MRRVSIVRGVLFVIASEGSAKASVLCSGYGIGISSVPRVANVSDEVDLELEFTAP